MGVANERSRRFGCDKETVFETTAAGAFINPSAPHDVAVNPDRDSVDRQEHLNTFGDLYPPDPGVQLFDAAAGFDHCTQTAADLDKLMTAACGQKESVGTALTYVNAGSTTSLIKVSAGTPQKIIRLTGNDGKIYMLPVKSFTSGTDINLAMQAPAAAIGAGATLKSPSEVTGGIYSYLLGTAADTFMCEWDRAGQSGQIKYRSWGTAVKSAAFVFELRKRLSWLFGFTASRWEVNPGAPAFQLADPVVRTAPFLGFSANISFYQTSAVAAASSATKLKKMSFQLAPKLIEESGTKGMDGAGLVASSDITGYTRAERQDDRLKVTLTYPDANWHARWDPTDATTYYGCFAEFFPSKPTLGPKTPRLAVWFPYLMQAKEPSLSIANAGEVQDLEFQIGRDSTNSLNAFYIAMTTT